MTGVQTCALPICRQRPLALTAKGSALERRLFERQRDHLAPALADPDKAAAFRAVLRVIMDDAARDYLDSTYRSLGDDG